MSPGSLILRTITCAVATALSTGRPLQVSGIPGNAPKWDGCRVGLVYVQTNAEEPAYRFGLQTGWVLDSATSPLALNVEETEARVTITMPWVWAEYGNTLLIEVDANGASARSTSCSPMSLASSSYMVGVVAVIDEGSSMVLEYELYDPGDLLCGHECYGRIPLRELAKSGAAQRLLQWRRSPSAQDRTASLQTTVDKALGLAVRGHVDSCGRRQGLWETLDGAGSVLLVSSWNDGIPDGSYSFAVPSGSNRGIGMFVDGFRSGTSIEWRSTGDRIVTQWSLGLMHGQRIIYAADGGEKLREYYDCGELASAMRQGVRTVKWLDRLKFRDSVCSLYTRARE